MAWELTLAAVYYPLAALFQLGLAGLVLSTGSRKPVRIAVALLLGLGGFQTMHLFLKSVAATPFPDPTNRLIDTAILLTIAYLATQFPTPAGGERGARTARRAWIASLIAIPGGLAVLRLVNAPLFSAVRGTPHEIAFAVGAGALAIHLVPRWLELERGPLQTQTLYAGAALVMSVTFIVGRRIERFVEPSWVVERILAGPKGASSVLMHFFVAVILVRLAIGYHRDRQPQTLAFLGLVGLGVALGTAVSTLSIEGPAEFATQVGRPILFALAMLRFDLFRIPLRVRRVALPTTAVFLASLAFLVLAGFLDPGGLNTTTLNPLSALGATMLLATGLVVGNRWFKRAFLEPLASEEPPEDRIDRYRLELERSHAAGGGEVDLEAARHRLGVTETEHAVLEHLLDQHVVLSAAAVRGAVSGDVVAGRFEVDRELGRGGHGRALLAWDRDQERSVVLKEVLHPWQEGAQARREALERELALVGDLEARGLARVYDLVEDGPRLYLVREFVTGSTLSEILDDEGPLEPSRVTRLVSSIAETAGRMHDHGVLHLDLKPDNVILAEDGQPVIIDHGTVHQLREERATSQTGTLDTSGPPVGTLAWMAPEQVLDEPVDERTDVFALGALAYHLATGRHHVDTDRPAFEVEDAIVHGTPPEDAPGPLADGIAAALSRAPEQRPGSVEALLDRWGVEKPGEASGAEDEQASAHADDVPG